MRFASANLRDIFLLTAMCTAGFAGCGNTCISGVIDNGKAVVGIKTADPPPTCPLSHTHGAIRILVLKSQLCETCTTDARVQHIFVTLKSVQLARSMPGAVASDWLEIAPDLADQPRQIDLIGDSPPETWVERNVPAETYDEVRLGLSSDADSYSDLSDVESACGRSLRDCVITGDGRIEPLHWPGAPELVIAARSLDGDPLIVLPDSVTGLQFSFALQRGFSSSSLQRSALQNVLVGRATAVRAGQANEDFPR